MSPENFCYWLQGWFELNDSHIDRLGASPETLDVIRDHLALVFTKVTGYQEIDTTFSGTKSQPVCGSLPTEEDYLREQRAAIKKARENMKSPGVSILGDEETRYC